MASLHEAIRRDAATGNPDEPAMRAEEDQIQAELDVLVASLREHRKTCSLWYCYGDDVFDAILTRDVGSLAAMLTSMIEREARA